MAVLVPLNDADALVRLAQAGVGEVYVGFHDEGWEERFAGAELNRMSGFGREANPFDFAQMRAQLARARTLGMRAFVCFNASHYSAEQAAFIERRYLAGIAEAGGEGVILSGQALVRAAREAGLGAVISTVAGVFNERLAAYYRDLGATRVILPRDLSADEIEGVVRAVPELEYEVFLMRNGCMFSDSHCLGCHRAGAPSLCTSLRTGECAIELAEDLASRGSGAWPEGPLLAGGPTPAGGSALAGDPTPAGASAWAGGQPWSGVSSPFPADAFLKDARHNEWLLNTYYHRRTCGLCALWRFEQLGIAAYKVVGRGDDADDLVADAALVARNAALARECPTQADYFAAMERPRDPQTLCGYDGLSCYYPELARTRAS